MPIDVTQFHQAFFEESFEGLDVMETHLLSLDSGSPDKDTINNIFRAAHSIKGGSGTFGFSEISSFTHLMETLLDEMRSGKRAVEQNIVNTLLQAVDVLREMIVAAKNNTEANKARVAEVNAALQMILNSDKGRAPLVSAVPVEIDNRIKTEGWLISFRPLPHLFATGNDPVRILRELSLLGEMEAKLDDSALPDFRQLKPVESYIGWDIKLLGDIAKEKINEIFEWVEGDCKLVISSLGGENKDSTANLSPSDIAAQKSAQTQKNQAPDQKKTALAPETNSIRVSIDKIDSLINMVGELVITQSMLGQVGTSIEEMDVQSFEKLRNGLTQLERNTRELQERVMRIRMLPINFTFSRFPRLVHDLSQKLGKIVELKISGEQTELDKTVLEKIIDPLVHLVRNAVDHGIEPPHVRVASGKAETGIIHLDAYHKGGNIVIEISDDGAGLNKEKILAKARKQGIVGEELLSDDQVHELIFHAGLSTAETVSDVSGRGVGMDVVQKNIKELGGKIAITSAPGKGSKITIRLPLTLAILDGQLVRVRNQIFVIPLVAIVESLRMNKELINSVTNKAELYRLRNDYISIVRLHEVFNITADHVDLEAGLLVVAEGDGKRIGIFVDDLLGQQQVVIKSLETNFRKVDGVSGATILGDGTVALILDMPGLVDLHKSGNYKKIRKILDKREVA